MAAGSDFADWLSPILVKELRQGLKTRMFVSVFILLQAVMIIIVGLQLLSMARGAGRSQMQEFDWFFWAVIWVPLLVVMPARGLAAVSSELKANTLDLVQLTKLTAFRIVLGKWVALVAQTLLLVAAVLPYTVLRYFFGRVDVVMDLTMLLGMVQGSLVLTAMAVMLSSMHLVVRILVVLAALPLSAALVSAVGMFMTFRTAGSGLVGATSAGAGVWMWLFGILGTVVTVYFLLEMAAGRIAPLAENHSGRRRAVALGLVLILPLIIWMNDDPNMALVGLVYSMLPLWAWSVLEALCERTVMVPSLYRPFARRGFWGRLAGRVFYPGWASGVVFVGLMMVLLGGMILIGDYLHNDLDGVWSDIDEWGVAVPLLMTSLVLPVLVMRLFPRMKQPVWVYLLVQALFVLLFLVAWIIAEVPGATRGDRDSAYVWLAPFPFSAFLGLMTRNFSWDLVSAYMVVSLPVCGLVWMGLGVVMWKEFRVIRGLERESLGDVGSDSGTKS